MTYEAIAVSAATAIAANVVEQLITAIPWTAEKLAKGAIQKDKKEIQKYIVNRAASSDRLKNILYDDSSVSIKQIYSKTRFLFNQNGKKYEFDNEFFLKSILNNWHFDEIGHETPIAAIIEGVGGCGKTIFLRWLFLNLIEQQSTRIPILVEMRDRSIYQKAIHDDTDIVYIIENEFAQHGSEVSKEFISAGLKSGKFIILFDGLDETPSAYFDDISEIVSKACNKYAQCPIVLSGRPDTRYRSWDRFKITKVARLDNSEINLLIDKLEIEESLKNSFIQELSMFQRSEFLSRIRVPLFIIVLLISYISNRKISINQSEFFDELFSALWHKHDGHKEGLKRERASKLSKSRFKRLLCATSASLYKSGLYRFSEDDFSAHCLNAVNLTTIYASPDDFLDDLLRNVSLCVYDNHFIEFIHRSFQEYFAARYICSLDNKQYIKAIGMISDQFYNDDVIKYIYYIDSERFLDLYFVREYEKAIDGIEIRALGAEEYVNVFAQKKSKISMLRSLFKFVPSNLDFQFGFNRDELDEYDDIDAEDLFEEEYFDEASDPTPELDAGFDLSFEQSILEEDIPYEEVGAFEIAAVEQRAPEVKSDLRRPWHLMNLDILNFEKLYLSRKEKISRSSLMTSSPFGQVRKNSSTE